MIWKKWVPADQRTNPFKLAMYQIFLDKPFLNPVSALSFRPKFPEMPMHSFNIVGDAGGNTRRLRFSDEEP